MSLTQLYSQSMDIVLAIVILTIASVIMMPETPIFVLVYYCAILFLGVLFAYASGMEFISIVVLIIYAGAIWVLMLVYMILNPSIPIRVFDDRLNKLTRSDIFTIWTFSYVVLLFIMVVVALIWDHGAEYGEVITLFSECIDVLSKSADTFPTATYNLIFLFSNGYLHILTGAFLIYSIFLIVGLLRR